MATTSVPIAKPTPSFLGVPLEIRQEIYRYLLVFPDYITLDDKIESFVQATTDTEEKGSTTIISVSKQINEEALDVLYGENRFAMTLAPRDRCQPRYKWGPRNWHRIRQLSLWAPDDVDENDTPYILREPIWWSVFANLTKLCVVACLPVEGKHLEAALKEDIKRWGEWLERVLLWMDDRVPKGLVIELDDYGEKEIEEIARRCFVRAKFELVISELGDAIIGWDEVDYLDDSDIDGESVDGFEDSWGGNNGFDFDAQQFGYDAESAISTPSVQLTSDWL